MLGFSIGGLWFTRKKTINIEILHRANDMVEETKLLKQKVNELIAEERTMEAHNVNMIVRDRIRILNYIVELTKSTTG